MGGGGEPECRKSGCPVESLPARLPVGASRKARGYPLFRRVENRGAPDWRARNAPEGGEADQKTVQWTVFPPNARASLRGPGCRRDPICRGTNRVMGPANAASTVIAYVTFAPAKAFAGVRAR